MPGMAAESQGSSSGESGVQPAGLFLFAVDLLLVFALDRVLWGILPKSWKSA